MVVRALARRWTSVFVWLLVPTLALVSFNPWPQLVAGDHQVSLADSLAASDRPADPSTPLALSGLLADRPVTLRTWEDTHGKMKHKKSGKSDKSDKSEKSPKRPKSKKSKKSDKSDKSEKGKGKGKDKYGW